MKKFIVFVEPGTVESILTENLICLQLICPAWIHAVLIALSWLGFVSHQLNKGILKGLLDEVTCVPNCSWNVVK